HVCSPDAVAVDSNGNLYVADSNNDRVLGYLNPLAAGGTPGTPGASGDVTADVELGVSSNKTSFATGNDTCDSGGTPTANSALCYPAGVRTDTNGNVYVGDYEANKVVVYLNPFAAGNATAGLEFGQGTSGNDFTAYRCSTPTSSSLCGPVGLAIDTNGDVYVAGVMDDRVVAFQQSGHSPPANFSADLVFGQKDFVHDGVNITGNQGLNTPGAAAIDASVSPNRVFAADTLNNRVLGWLSLDAYQSGAAADLVLGQPDFLSSDCNRYQAGFGQPNAPPTAATMCSPTGVAVDSGGNLYVADEGNSRVLEYNAPFSACSGGFPCVGNPANLVIGQGSAGNNFTSAMGSLANQSANALFDPNGVAVDSAGNLYVADTDDGRVLIYLRPVPFGGGTPGAPGSAGDVTADMVFGRGSSPTCFTVGCGGSDGADQLSSPYGAAIDHNGNLYVADFADSRVLMYRNPLAPGGGTPGTPGASGDVTADLVFGQGSLGNNFTTRNCADGVAADPAPSSTAMCSAAGVAVDSAGNVYISDYDNSRVLEFNQQGANPPNNVTANLVLGQGASGTAFAANACADGTNGAPGTSATAMCGPLGIAV